MLTRCPSCATTFRISPEQLKARQGRVRCGKCRNVFNALETLIEEPPQPVPAVELEAATVPEEAITARPESAPPAPEPDVAPTPAPPQAAPSPLEAPEAEPTPVAATPPEREVAAAERAATDRPKPSKKPSPPAEHEDEAGEPETLVDYAPAFESLMVEEAPRRAWPWVLGTLIALPALAVQAALHFRVDLAVMAPETKPALHLLCAYAGCDLPRPSKVELVAIESSDLHPDPANPKQLQLVATLKNRAGFSQEYPHLELTLTDTTDKALLRRALAPTDYLPKDKPAAMGFAANAELGVNLVLAVKDVAPVGYRLYVFYP
jgi:predicted Zn finger-like uncharacterized protein